MPSQPYTRTPVPALPMSCSNRPPGRNDTCACAPLQLAVTPAVNAPAVKLPPVGKSMMKRPCAVLLANVPVWIMTLRTTALTAPFVMVEPSAGGAPLPALKASSYGIATATQPAALSRYSRAAVPPALLRQA